MAAFSYSTLRMQVNIRRRLANHCGIIHLNIIKIHLNVTGARVKDAEAEAD